MDALLPNGFWHYSLGGLLIGLGVGLVYASTGRIAGVSSFFTAAHSWWLRSEPFRGEDLKEERSWKGVLVIGIVAGSALTTLVQGAPFATGVVWWRLLLGGVLVGFGTRRARGCTSGHGICGVASGAPPSIASTALFVGVAILTAQLILPLIGGGA